MTRVTSKVCVVGDFAVGKTSVVERFVTNQFSEKYLSTVGVKIDTKEIDFPAPSGFIYVADGTRPDTLTAIEHLHSQITEKYGAAAFVLLINKRDLMHDWTVSDEYLDALSKSYGNVYRTSAKTGDDVEQAITRLAELIIDNDMRGA